MTAATEPLPARVRVGYGLGSVATGAFGTVPGLMLLPYLTDTLGVAALVAGLVVVAPKAWDVVLNPVAGRISDRTVDPRGPRRPWLLRAGVVLAACFALLFASPDLGSRGLETAYVLVVFLACASAYAFFQVPYVAMPAEITAGYAERTRLMTWRVAILALTILVAGATAPLLRDALGGRDGYRLVGAVMALVILAGVVGAYLGTRRAPVGAVQPGPGTLRDQLRVVAGARDFRLLLTTWVLQALATGTMLAGVDYLAGDVLADGSATVLFACFVGPALLVTPAWSAVGDRVGKRRAYLAASLVLAAGAALAAGARVAPAWVVVAAVALVGVGYAGCQVFPLAMLPDVAAADAARTGENRTGVYTGVWTAGETLGLALGPGVFAAALALGSYRSSTGEETVVQPDSALTAITLGFAVVPALLVVASLWWLARYRLEREDLTP